MKLDLSDAPLGADDQQKKPLDLSGAPLVDTTLHDNYAATAHTDPKKNSEQIAVAEKTGLDPAFVAKNPEGSKKLADAASPAFLDHVQQNYPGTSKFLADPKNMARAHDEIADLAGIEHASKSMREVDSFWSAIKSGFQGSATGLGLRGKLPDAEVTEETPEKYRLASQTAGLVSDAPEIAVGMLAGSELGPLGSMAGGFAAPAMMKKYFRQSIEKGSIKGVGDVADRNWQVMKEGIKQGTVGLFTGLAGMGAGPLAGFALGKTGIGAHLANKIGSSMLLKLAAENATMTTAGAAVEGRMPKGRDFLENMAQVGMMEGVSHGLGVLDAAAKSSKLRERDPQAFADHMSGIAPPVRIPVEAFDTHFGADGEQAKFLGIEKQYGEAKATGGDVVIPMGTWLRKEMDTHREALEADRKLSHDSLTPNQYKEAQDAAKEEAKAAQEKIEAESKMAKDADVKPPKPDQINAYAIHHVETSFDANKPPTPEEVALGAKEFPQTHGGKKNVPPNEVGRAQLEELYKNFKDFGMTKVVGPDYARTRETGEAVGSFEPDKRLEAMDIGDNGGVPIEEFKPLLKAELEKAAKDPAHKMFGQETFNEFQARALKARAEIMAQAKPGDKIAFSLPSDVMQLFKLVDANGGMPLIGDQVLKMAKKEGIAPGETYTLKQPKHVRPPTAEEMDMMTRHPEITKDAELLNRISTEEKQPKLNQILQSVAEKVGGQIKGSPKSVQSIVGKIVRKVENDGIQDYTGLSLKDLSRGAIIADPAGIVAAARELGQHGIKLESFVEIPLNKFGYRGLHGSVDLGDGFRGEIQFHTPESWEIKESSDKIYRTWRPYGDAEIADWDTTNRPKKLEYVRDMRKSRQMWRDYWAKVPSETRRAISESAKGLESVTDPSLREGGLTQDLEGGSKTSVRSSENQSSLPSANLERSSASVAEGLGESLTSDPMTSTSRDSIPPGPGNVKGTLSPEQRALVQGLSPSSSEFATTEAGQAVQEAAKDIGLAGEPLGVGAASPEELERSGEAMDPRSKRAYKLQAAAFDEAERRLAKGVMQQFSRDNREFLESERRRLTKEHEGRLQGEPVFRAEDDLQNVLGKRADPLDLARRYTEGGPEGQLSDEELAQFEAVAIMNGFSGGDHMAQAIIAARRAGGFEGEVGRRVEGNMQQYAGLQDRPTMKEETLRALHNEKSMDLLAEQQSILADMQREANAKDQVKEARKETLGQARELRDRGNAQAEAQRRVIMQLSKDAAKEQAKQFIASKPVEEINWRPYVTAERNAAMRWQKAMDEGDLLAAQKAKTEQMNAHALVSEAFKMKDNIDRWRGNIETVTGMNKSAFKAQAHFDQAGELLARFGFEHPEYNAREKQESLPDWADRMENSTNSVEIQPWLMNEGVRKNWKQLTPDELHDVSDALKNIRKIANFEDKTYVMFDKLDFQAGKNQLLEELAANKKGGWTPSASMKEPWSLGVLRKLNAADLSLLRPETILRTLDGGKQFGKWWNALYKPFTEGMEQKSDDTISAIPGFREIWSEYKPKERYEMDNKKIFLPEINDSLTKNEIMGMAYHTGTNENIQRLIEGKADKGWSPEGINAILDREMTKRDWDSVQKGWDFIGQYWPRISRFYEEKSGFAPRKVEARSFVNQHGLYKGGYFPLQADSRFVIKEAQRMADDKSLSDGAGPEAWRASTRNGFSKARVTGAQYEVSLDVNKIQRHLVDVIHDLNMRNWVLDANKLMADKGVQAGLTDAIGQEGYRSLKKWIDDTAAEGRQATPQWYDSVADWARQRSAIAQLGLRVSTMLSQTHGVFTFANVDPQNFGYSQVGKALFDFYGRTLSTKGQHFKDTMEFIHENSAFMRGFEKELDTDLAATGKNLWGKDDRMAEVAMAPFRMIDKFTSFPVWMGAYRRGLDVMQGDQAKAVDYADSIIRRGTPARRYADLPQIMRQKGAAKLFMMYYGFFNTQYNLEHELVQQGGAANLARAAGLWFFTSQAYNFFHYGLPTDADSQKKYLKETFASAFMVPGGRAFADSLVDSLVSHKFEPKWSDISPAFDLPASAFTAISKLANPHKTGEQKAEAVASAASLWAPYPAYINSVMGNVYDYVTKGMTPRASDIMHRRPAKERM